MTLHPALGAAATLAATVLVLAAFAVPAWRAVRAGRDRRAWILRTALVLCLLTAAWRPGVPGAEAKAAVNEVNVFFAVDLSTSSTAEDYAGAQRLEGMRADIAAIGERLAGAKFALVTFDTRGTVRMPLTSDPSALESAAEVMRPGYWLYSKGSSISAGGEALRERLEASAREAPERPRIVFYLGDGEQTSAEPATALGIDRALVQGGAVLGYGTSSGGRMRENPPFADGSEDFIQDPATDTDALSRIDEAALRTIAEELGVPYAHRAPGDPVDEALAAAAPGQLRATEESGLFGRFEFYWMFALAGFGLALVEIARSARALAQALPTRRRP
ncbi:VWA domain-containing protein [Sinomonas halotolerans]|uniref:VWA domain-containing protein n=1 Tax=Sinomonas halotolerans TaxID=1644133 RepID=A0ABU9WZR0_9MICC